MEILLQVTNDFYKLQFFNRERRRFVHSMILYMYQRRWRLDMFRKSTHNAVNTVPFFVLIPNMILLYTLIVHYENMSMQNTV